MNDIVLLNPASNAVVAKHIDREYPGVLIQGDTLRNILDDIDELQEELVIGDFDSAKEVSELLQTRFTELLKHYEEVMEENGISLPYVKSVRK